MSTNVASQSGTFKLGGERTVTRLGYGSMQLTGKGVWGDPDDPDNAVRVLRWAVAVLAAAAQWPPASEGGRWSRPSLSRWRSR